MLDEKTIERLRNKFPKYSSAMIEADWAYYRTCDPMYFLRIAAQFELSAYVTRDTGEGRDLLPDNEEKFKTTRASFLRYLRYISSEKLIILLISGYPFGPAPKAFSGIRNDAVISLFEAISDRRVPKGFEIYIKKEEVDFRIWLSVLLFQNTTVDDKLISQFEDFIVREARLLLKREVINAFKHGRTQAPIQGQPFQIYLNEDKGGKKSVLQNMEGGVHWLGWEEAQSPQLIEHALVIGFEETNGDQDCETIKATAVLEKLIVDIRRGVTSEDSQFDVFFPDLDSESNKYPPQRMVIKNTTTWKPKSGNRK